MSLPHQKVYRPIQLGYMHIMTIITRQSEYKHSLIFRVRRYVVIATKLVHRLQIRPIVHN